MELCRPPAPGAGAPLPQPLACGRHSRRGRLHVDSAFGSLVGGGDTGSCHLRNLPQTFSGRADRGSRKRRVASEKRHSPHPGGRPRSPMPAQAAAAAGAPHTHWPGGWGQTRDLSHCPQSLAIAAARTGSLSPLPSGAAALRQRADAVASQVTPAPWPRRPGALGACPVLHWELTAARWGWGAKRLVCTSVSECKSQQGTPGTGRRSPEVPRPRSGTPLRAAWSHLASENIANASRVSKQAISTQRPEELSRLAGLAVSVAVRAIFSPWRQSQQLHDGLAAKAGSVAICACGHPASHVAHVTPTGASALPKTSPSERL